MKDNMVITKRFDGSLSDVIYWKRQNEYLIMAYEQHLIDETNDHVSRNDYVQLAIDYIDYLNLQQHNKYKFVHNDLINNRGYFYNSKDQKNYLYVIDFDMFVSAVKYSHRNEMQKRNLVEVKAS